MGLLDFLKQKEFAEIICLKKDLEISANKEAELNKKIEELKKECNSLSQFKSILDLENRKVTMFVNAANHRSSGRVVPPLAAGRSPTEDLV